MAFVFSTPLRPTSADRAVRVPRRRQRARAAAATPPRPPVPIPDALSSVRVVGLGGCGMDMVAQVASFPAPDEKIRTTSVVHAGGGNTANTLTGVRRLGLPCSLVTKIGDDANGALVLAELERDGVETAEVVVSARTGTPFTYVIVDAETASRTCIHSPAVEDLLARDVAGKEAQILEGARLLVLDSRHAGAALALAKEANARGIPVLLDVEREREGLQELIIRADYIVASRSFPMVAEPGAGGRVDAMTRMLLRAGGRARAVISTAGESGSTMVLRHEDDARERGVRDRELVVTRERMAAVAVGRYGAGASRGRTGGEGEVVVLECPSCVVKDVVDTCGAGDAFIAGVAYGIAVGLSVEGMLGLGTRVAAKQIGMLGARTGLPRRDEIDVVLLTPLPKF